MRDNTERTNCDYRQIDIVSCEKFIKDSNLMNLKFSNEKFTWFDTKGKSCKSDRFLLKSKWFEGGKW